MVNHFIHRDYTVMGGEVHLDIYDDRLTVTSPGGMYFIFVRCRNVLCCYHWLFLWYFIPLDSPILQENLIECICQRFQCIFSFDWFQLAFPNGDRMPAHSGKFMLNFHISLLVPLYFVDPKLSIGFRYSVIATAFVPMPKASIHKDARSVLPHHDIWFP